MCQLLSYGFSTPNHPSSFCFVVLSLATYKARIYLPTWSPINLRNLRGLNSFLLLASLPAKCYSPRKTPPPWKEQFLPISAELCAVCLPLVGQVLLCTAQTYQLASHLLRGLCFSFKGPSAMVQQFNHRKFISLPPQS